MDPWGIPHVRGAVDDVNSPKATEKLLQDILKQSLETLSITEAM